MQVHSGDLKQNAVYLTAGTWIPEEFYFSLLGNYERSIVELRGSFPHSLLIRIGAGPWAGWGPSGVNIVSTLNAMTGKKAAHFELGSGILFTYWSAEKEFRPIINNRHIAGFLGFRYQKPDDSFVFRTGAGWPDGIYLSLGFCF